MFAGMLNRTTTNNKVGNCHVSLTLPFPYDSARTVLMTRLWHGDRYLISRFAGGEKAAPTKTTDDEIAIARAHVITRDRRGAIIWQ